MSTASKSHSVNNIQVVQRMKQDILDAVIFNYDFPVDFDIESFKKSWIRTKFFIGELESLTNAYFVRNRDGKCYIVFFSSKKSITNSHDIGFIIVPSDGLFAKKLRRDLKTNFMQTKKESKKWKISYTVIDEISLHKSNKNNSTISNLNESESAENKKSKTDNRYFEVYVFFRLTNTCMQKKHPIENVTAITTNAINGEQIKVNVYHCISCNKYFINYEALKDYISRRVFPALPYSLANSVNGSLNEASKLMLYGYSVAEGKLSLNERRSILSWIIDSGLLSKSEIIKDLQFKVRYNGSKAGNENAKIKWQDDIQFVSRYIKDNSRIINATFIRGK